jgi:hypothetical protein
MGKEVKPFGDSFAIRIAYHNLLRRFVLKNSPGHGRTLFGLLLNFARSLPNIAAKFRAMASSMQ